MQEARIELLQRMPIFGGIRTEILQFLLASCPIVSVLTNGSFSASTTKAMRCSSLKWAKPPC